MRHTQQNSEQIQNFNSVFKEAFKFQGQVTSIDDEHIYLSGDMNAAQKLNASLKDLENLKTQIAPNVAHVPTEEEVTKRAEEKTKIALEKICWEVEFYLKKKDRRTKVD